MQYSPLIININYPRLSAASFGGNRSDNFDAGDKISRDEVKERSGLSDRQITTALRVANIPQDQFEAQVDSDKPPTLSQLASQGTFLELSTGRLLFLFPYFYFGGV